MVFKFILLTYSLLISCLLIATAYAFYNDFKAITIFVIFIVGIIFLFNAYSAFIFDKKPQILLLPILCFALFGVAEMFSISAGIINDKNGTVKVLHWLLLVTLRVIIPLCMALACFTQMKKYKFTPKGRVKLT